MDSKKLRCMKRLAKTLLCLLLAVAMCSGTYLAAFEGSNPSVKAAEEELENVARNKAVTATDSMAGGGLYDPSHLTDGKYGNYPAEQQLGWNVSARESATIDLGGTASISKVVLYPVTFEQGKFFPTAYTISVSVDGEEWIKVGEASDVPEVGTTPQEIVFETVDAALVKVEVTPRDVVEKDGSTSTYAQVSEVEVYGVKGSQQPPVSDTTLGLQDYALDGYLNLALNKEGVTASDDNAHFGKAAKHVVDGILEDTDLFGWDTYGSQGIAWLQIDLDGICNIERVVVYPFWTSKAVGEYFPAEYQLQLSVDGENFTTIDTYKNPDPRGYVTGAVIHDFAETEARYVRINVTKANPKLWAEYGNDPMPHSQIGEVNVYGFSRNIGSYDPYIPAGSVDRNLALGKSAVATDDNAQWGMAAAHTTDGLLTNTDPYGWSTNQSADEKTGIADLTIDLKNSAALSRFVVYPFYIGADVGVYFPRAYEIQVSEDGETFTTVASKAGNTHVTRPQIIDLDQKVSGRYVRLHVTSGGYNGDSGLPYCTQVGEVSVYGVYEAEAASINKTALRMIPGDKDYLKISYYGIGEPKVTYKSENSSIASVSEDGEVIAVAYGNTTIHVKEATTGAEYEVSVLVDNYVATENFMITAFWPIQNYNINDDYLDKMQEAGITNIQLNFVLNTANYKDNMTIAQMAYERGMGITVSEKAWGWGAIADFTDEQIYQEALKYSHVPGVIGYYVIDEPASAAPFAHCFAPIKKAMPTADVHLNFVPNMANYTSLLDLVGKDLDYLMWDSYIYPNSGCLEANLFKTSDEARKLALKYGVKTAQFIQSCGFNGAFRKPNGNEIRYNVSAAIAYGNKQLAYFTYRIPEDVGETFTSAIVNADGSKTEIFDDVAEINNAVLKLGPTLMSLEALEVYHTGRESGANNPLPKDFFLQPAEGTDLIVSYMRNGKTKQNYVMLVNRDYEKEAAVDFTVAEEISSLEYISEENGEATPLAGSGQEYSAILEPGGRILIKVPADYDWTPNYGEFVETPAGENAALSENTSVTARGKNPYQLTDGARIPNTYTDGCGLPGFTADVENGVTVTLNFGGNQTMNRVDLYPGSTDKFPSDFTLEGSADGTEWKTILEKTGYKPDANEATVLKFDTAKYRYLRLNVKGTPSGKLQLCELEVYHDDGSMPALHPLNGAMEVDKELKPQDNLARAEGVKTLYSDSNEAAPYWLNKNINDGIGYDAIGRGNAGWCSLVNRLSAVEEAWVGYDLGKTKNIDKVIVFNAWDDRGAKKAECFPADYCVEVSRDGENWVPVYAVYNDSNWEQVGARVMEFESVAARYVRFRGTRLGRCGEGFALQLSELEVYGTDYDGPELEDYETAKQALAAYRAEKNDKDYREAQIAELDAAVEAGNAAIDQAATADAILAALETAKKAMDAVKTDAQLTAEENAAGEKDKDDTTDKNDTTDNTDKKDPAVDNKDSDSPKTGDEFDIVMYVVLLAAAVLGIAVLGMLGWKKSKRVNR